MENTQKILDVLESIKQDIFQYENVKKLFDAGIITYDAYLEMRPACRWSLQIDAYCAKWSKEKRGEDGMIYSIVHAEEVMLK